MSKAEEDNVNLVERHFGRKLHFCVAHQSFVYIIYFIACITLGVGKDDFYLRMVEE